MASPGDNSNNEWKDLQLSLNQLLQPAPACDLCGLERLPVPSYREQLEKEPNLNFCCQQFYDRLVGSIVRLAELDKTESRMTHYSDRKNDEDEYDDGGDGDDDDHDGDGDEENVEDDVDKIGVRYEVKFMETTNYSHMFESTKTDKSMSATKHGQAMTTCGHHGDGDDDDDYEGNGDDDDDDNCVSWKFHLLEAKILNLLKKLRTYVREADEDNDDDDGIARCQKVWKDQCSTIFHPTGHVAVVRLTGKTSTGSGKRPPLDHVFVDGGDGVLCIIRNGRNLAVNHAGKSKLRLWMNGSEGMEFHEDGSTRRTWSNDLSFRKFRVQASPSLTLEVISPTLVALTFNPSVGQEEERGGRRKDGNFPLTAELKLGTDCGTWKISELEILVTQVERLQSRFWSSLEKMRGCYGRPKIRL